MSWTKHLSLACVGIISFSSLPRANAVPNLAPSHNHNVRPFAINLSAGVPHLRELIEKTILPEAPEYPNLGDTAGIDLGILKSMRRQWLTEFDWQKEEDELNGLNHFTSNIEGLTVHYVHVTSSDPHAIPLLLNHGWPGSFLEFIPILKELTQIARTSIGKRVSFHVVAPSLPGFAFSSAPPANWTLEDTARIQHTLMVEVLGYKQFATHGTDYGSGPAYTLYANYSRSTRAAHFTFVPFLPLLPEQLATLNITLNSTLEETEQRNALIWRTTGNAYFSEQATKPNTIGLALYDNPVGQLAWMGEKFISWSDPRQGTGPSLLTHNDILRSVTLCYLTGSFLSSVFTYYQNPNTFTSNYTKADTDAPMLFSAFQYNVGFWPAALLGKIGNLVMFRNHEFGGHFAGVDNPAALIEDLREIANYWPSKV